LYFPEVVTKGLIHDYEFQGNLLDSLNPTTGPALVKVGPGGGGTVNASNYSFNAGQGLTLTGALPSGNTDSIEMVFQFATAAPPSLGGFARIIDFSNRTLDQGLYDHQGKLSLFNYGDDPTVRFADNKDIHVVITRDGTTGLVSTYVNGIPT